jgi:hypothetical protein
MYAKSYWIQLVNKVNTITVAARMYYLNFKSTQPPHVGTFMRTQTVFFSFCWACYLGSKIKFARHCYCYQLRNFFVKVHMYCECRSVNLSMQCIAVRLCIEYVGRYMYVYRHDQKTENILPNSILTAFSVCHRRDWSYEPWDRIPPWYIC